MGYARITPDGQVIKDSSFDGKTVLVPATRLSFFSIELPVKSLSAAQKIVAFTLEEEVADDIDNLHFAIKQDQDKWQVVVCEKQLINQWIELCQKNGFTPKRLVPDVLALPSDIFILQEPGQTCIQVPDEPPIAIQPSLLPVVLEKFKIDINQVEVTIADTYADLFSLTDKLSTKLINLIQGEYNPTTNVSRLIAPWVVGFVLFAFCGIAYITKIAIESNQLKEQTQLVKQQNIKLFRQSFPQIKRVVNLRAQAQQQFKKLLNQQQRSEGNLINLIEQIIPALQQETKVVLSNVLFRDYTMQLQLNANSVIELENFIRNLKNNSALNIGVQSLNQNENKSQATLKITRQL